MVGQIKTVNGVKKIVPLTAEARAGNPVSTIIAIYSNLVPYGYLPCNGVQFDETQFPALYAILGDNHTPDLRECALVGAGQNATDTIATHDVYNIGQFKDDQLQDHAHYNTRHTQDYTQPNSTWTLEEVNTYNWGDKDNVVWARLGRIGSTTHGKQKGVNYCIKATAGLDESDADYVLGVLAPVDEVAVNNMHSVTSNAVANMWEFGDLPADTGSYSSYSYGRLHYVLNKITNVCFIYGKVGSWYSDIVSLSYQGYVTTLPQGYVNDPESAMFFTGGSTGGAGAIPAKFQMRVGGTNGDTNSVQIRYYDNDVQNANVSALVKVKRTEI